MQIIDVNSLVTIREIVSVFMKNNNHVHSLNHELNFSLQNTYLTIKSILYPMKNFILRQLFLVIISSMLLRLCTSLLLCK